MITKDFYKDSVVLEYLTRSVLDKLVKINVVGNKLTLTYIDLSNFCLEDMYILFLGLFVTEEYSDFVNDDKVNFYVELSNKATNYHLKIDVPMSVEVDMLEGKLITDMSYAGELDYSRINSLLECFVFFLASRITEILNKKDTSGLPKISQDIGKLLDLKLLKGVNEQTIEAMKSIQMITEYDIYGVLNKVKDAII